MAQLGYHSSEDQTNGDEHQQVLQYGKKGQPKREKKDPWRHHGPKIKLMKERAERAALLQQQSALADGATLRSTTTTTTLLSTTTTTTTTTVHPPAFHEASARSAGVNSPYLEIDVNEVVQVVKRALLNVEKGTASA